jgi:superfamily II DNA or RNA helicase
MWSAQEYQQLVGRIHRYPQTKRVVVYRLIAKHSPDMFLNRLSQDKAQIFAAFVSAPKRMSKLMSSNFSAYSVLIN